MELVKAEVSVAKEAYELGLALGKLVLEAKKALADGAQVSDIPALLAAIMSEDVVKGIQGIDLLGEEAKADKAAFVSAFVVAGVKISEQLKQEPLPAA